MMKKWIVFFFLWPLAVSCVEKETAKTSSPTVESAATTEDCPETAKMKKEMEEMAESKAVDLQGLGSSTGCSLGSEKDESSFEF